MTTHPEKPQKTIVTQKHNYYFEVKSHLIGSQHSNLATWRLNNSATWNADCVITIVMCT